MRHRRLLVAAAAAGLLTVGWIASGHGAPGDGGQVRAQVPHAADGQGAREVPLKEAVGMLKVAEEGPHEGYSRDKFGLYTDDDGDGCDTRREVLIAEAVKGHKPEVTGECWLEGGKWISAYDGEVATGMQDMTIDHVVALGEAWDSGAREWPKDKLVEYGNYLKDPRHLIAVSGPSNSRKSDKDPAEWLPERDDFVCQFAADWTQVKVGWDLTADVKEKAALEALTGADGENGKKCGKTPVRVP